MDEYLQKLLDDFTVKYESRWHEVNRCKTKEAHLDGTVSFSRYGLKSTWSLKIGEPYKSILDDDFILEI